VEGMAGTGAEGAGPAGCWTGEEGGPQSRKFMVPDWILFVMAGRESVTGGGGWVGG